MEKETRNAIERATQRIRRILSEDFAEQLDGVYDIRPDGRIAETGGAHLTGREHLLRDKIVAAIEHKRAAGMTPQAAVADYIRDAAFTTLNRFAALKMLEARELVQECVSRGDASNGFAEFCGLAQGVKTPDGSGYRLYIESIFDELSTEVKVLFDRRDPAAVLWPKKATFDELLSVLNTDELKAVWIEDETIGWIYQFFNSGDERRKMREESQAPRNSRELAIRNQFFTPRYVVQFLCDNTLGRLWYEMRQGDTRLAGVCEYLVRPSGDDLGSGDTRPQKDPRDLRIIDPACGSGHFLLYCFVLLLLIYEEAWADENGPVSAATGRSLRSDYPTIDQLRRVVPLLILEHNLHGVDIDPRCAQIAQLALWMRAQRAFKDVDLARSNRPCIRRANIVTAEPMPGNAQLIDEFAATLRPALMGDLFREIASEMRLAGEMGALLQIDQKLTLSIDRARAAFVEQQTRPEAFLPGLAPSSPQGELDLSDIDNVSFFERAEAQILESLRKFALDAVNGKGTRRKLFADDAEQGIAFVELMGRRFDVVLMNPPFGAGSLPAKAEFERSYPKTKNDVYAAFVERGVEILQPHGMLGAITSRTGYFLSSFQKWREDILLKEAAPVVVADLGSGVLDGAMVEVACYCLKKSFNSTASVFLRVLESDAKSADLLSSIHASRTTTRGRRFDLDLKTFSSIPGTPFCYWVTDALRSVFKAFPSLERDERRARAGGQTSDDQRYLRCYWEIDSKRTSRAWRTYLKGGSAVKFYLDQILVAPWDEERETFPGFIGRPGRASEKPSNYDLYFRPGITWPLRASIFSPQAMPAESIFTVRSYAIIDQKTNLLALLAVLSSSTADYMTKLMLGRFGFPEFVVGVLQKLPIPEFGPEEASALSDLARRAWELRRSLEAGLETSHAFNLPLLLSAGGVSLEDRVSAWREHVAEIEGELAQIQSDIDNRSFDLYGMTEDDRKAVSVGLGGITDDDNSSDEPLAEELAEEEVDEARVESGPASLAADLISWAIGVAFGRFDIRLATGARAEVPETDPFASLTMSSPALLAEDDLERALKSPEVYPIQIAPDGILVSDEGHPRDIIEAVRHVFDAVFGANADAWWADLEAALGQTNRLRTWIESDFFLHHLKRYSRSGRKAPLIWQLGVPSGRYSIWMYIHQINRDTLLKLQNDILRPKIAHEERELENLLSGAGPEPGTALLRKIQGHQSLLGEIRWLLDEVERVTNLWEPTLDDGVILTMAPLWRLMPQYRSWQKEIRSKWDDLVAGKYDWAHLSIHLWPERVIAKCASNRSIAIAHGMEDLFWFEDEHGKWKPYDKPEKTIADLVRERTSAAVKAALKSLVEAPEVATGSKRSRNRKAA